MHLPLDKKENRTVKQTLVFDDGIQRLPEGCYTVEELRLSWKLSDEEILLITL